MMTLTPMPIASPVIFLDLDGVVTRNEGATTEDRVRPACTARLDALVRRTGARVVVSSSWRITCTPERIRRYLASAGYTGAIDSATPVLPEHTRGAEIRAWLDAHPGEASAFVILDDWPLDEFAGMLVHLVQTDYDAGLTDDDCARAEAILETQRVRVARRVFLAAHAALPRTAAATVAS